MKNIEKLKDVVLLLKRVLIVIITFLVSLGKKISRYIVKFDLGRKFNITKSYLKKLFFQIKGYLIFLKIKILAAFVKFDFGQKFKFLKSFLKKLFLQIKDLLILLIKKISEYIIKFDFRRKFRILKSFLKKVFINLNDFRIILKNKISALIVKIDIPWKIVGVLFFIVLIVYKSILFINSLAKKISEFIVQLDLKKKLNYVLIHLKAFLRKCKVLFIFLTGKLSEFIIKSDFKGKFKKTIFYTGIFLQKSKIILISLIRKLSGYIIRFDYKRKFIIFLKFLKVISGKTYAFIIYLLKKISAFIVRLDIKTKLIKSGIIAGKIIRLIFFFLVSLAGKLFLYVRKTKIKDKLSSTVLIVIKWFGIIFKKFIELHLLRRISQILYRVWSLIISFFRFIIPKVSFVKKIPFRELHKKIFGELTSVKAMAFIIFLVLFDILLIWFISYQVLFAKHYWKGNEDKRFVIKSSENTEEIINDLKSKDIIGNKLIFKVIIKLTGNDEKIISRRYLVKNGLSNTDILNILTDKNIVSDDRFTLIEGLRIKQMAKIVGNKLQLSPEKFIQETENDSLINILGLKGKIHNLEGFLFPDTYILPPDLDEKGLVEILFDEFRKKVIINPELSNQLMKSDKNLLSVITMASIIQGETGLKSEMPTIAGVYYNRLRINMKLEADPTIQYVLPDGPKPRLSYEDLKIESPYNTYKHYGLPPAPINNPGLAPIKAALNPENHNYLFFVANGKGGHKFSNTFEEHRKASEEFRRGKVN